MKRSQYSAGPGPVNTCCAPAWNNTKRSVRLGTFNDKAVKNFEYGIENTGPEILDRLWKPENGVLVAGFPLHLTHGRDGRAWSEVRDLLADDSDLVRIHLAFGEIPVGLETVLTWQSVARAARV